MTVFSFWYTHRDTDPGSQPYTSTMYSNHRINSFAIVFVALALSSSSFLSASFNVVVLPSHTDRHTNTRNDYKRYM